MATSAIAHTVVIAPEKIIPAITETTVTVTMDEQTALDLLALLGLQAGSPDFSGRANLAVIDKSQPTLARAIQKALGLDQQYVHSDAGISGKDSLFTAGTNVQWRDKHATREMFSNSELAKRLENTTF